MTDGFAGTRETMSEYGEAPTAPERPRGEMEIGSFPGSGVVQRVSGIPYAADAGIEQLHPARVVVTDVRIAATEGPYEWSWLLHEISAVIHGAVDPWSVIVVPGITDFGVIVPADQVDAFRTAVSRVVDADKVQFQAAPEPKSPVIDLRPPEDEPQPAAAFAPAPEASAAVPWEQAPPPVAEPSPWEQAPPPVAEPSSFEPSPSPVVEAPPWEQAPPPVVDGVGSAPVAEAPPWDQAPAAPPLDLGANATAPEAPPWEQAAPPPPPLDLDANATLPEAPPWEQAPQPAQWDGTGPAPVAGEDVWQTWTDTPPADGPAVVDLTGTPSPAGYADPQPAAYAEAPAQVPPTTQTPPVQPAAAPQARPRRFGIGGRNVVESAADITPHETLAGLDAQRISAWFGDHQVLDRCSLNMKAGDVTALIGPSGCGKSTFLRIMNRMHEMIPTASLSGQVMLDGYDIYDPARKLTDARREIGMVFQKPNPFPAMSIYDNVLASFRLTGVKATTGVKDEVVESCLSKAGLWNEVKDRLRQPGGGLSGGQQQRLCIARALAIQPRVLLMDEPCSALDPTSTRRIEETIVELVNEVTIVIVTHNMQQAARVSDHCAFFLAEHGTPGVIVEHGPTSAMFEAPQDPRTFDYVNGRFG